MQVTVERSAAAHVLWPRVALASSQLPGMRFTNVDRIGQCRRMVAKE